MAHRRRNIETSALVQVRFWTLIAENVLPMVCSKRSGIFPLRVGDLVSLANRNPAILANGDARPLIRFVKPRNDPRRFGPVASGGFVVVGKCVIKGILPRSEFRRNVIPPARRIVIVKAAVTFRPLFVPRTDSVRHRIVFTRFFAYPEKRRHNLLLPRIT